MKRTLLIFALLVSSYFSIAQMKILYGREFDYKMIMLKDTVSADSLPDFYIQCSYNGTVLKNINIFQRYEWMHKPIITYIKVVQDGIYTFFIYNFSKVKVGGYGRLFSKKTKATDTAILVHDTLIFKETTKYKIHLQYVTSIFSDTIIVEDKYFPVTKRQGEHFLLRSFGNYQKWPSLENYSSFYNIYILPFSGMVITGKKMADDGKIDYSFGYRRDQSFFKNLGLKPSLFWAKHLGVIY